MITYYTPCYNKAQFIDRTFRSLLDQTIFDFEWIVINDGSTDNSWEIIERFNTDKFKVRKVNKKNEGLSSVMNLAVELAKGDYILRVDGDDWLIPKATEIILQNLSNIIMQDPKVGCAVFLTQLSNGKICGHHPFDEITRCDFISYRQKYGANGDRAEVFKTDYFKEFPMPIIPGEKFVLESYVWNHFAEKYDAVYFPIAIYCRDYNMDSMTSNWPSVGLKNPKGIQLVFSDLLNHTLSKYNFLWYSVMYYRYSLHSDYSIWKLVKDVPLLSTFIGLPLGGAFYVIEKIDPNFEKNLRKILSNNKK